MSRSGLRASARMQPATARLNGSVGDSLDGVLGLMLEDIDHACPPSFPLARKDGEVGSAQRDIHGAFRQLLAETALIELCDRLALELVALVDEGHAECEADIAEDIGVLGPGNHRARAHHG